MCLHTCLPPCCCDVFLEDIPQHISVTGSLNTLVRMSLHVPMRMSAHMSVHMSTRMPIHRSVHTSMHMFAHMSVRRCGGSSQARHLALPTPGDIYFMVRSASTLFFYFVIYFEGDVSIFGGKGAGMCRACVNVPQDLAVASCSTFV